MVEGDVAGTGEEDFETGMRQNAMERDAADADNDGKLDFTEFCQFVRDREEGEFTEEELRKRFNALDEDGSGKVDMAEYLLWSLKEALSRSAQRVVDLFRAWDEDKSGTVDKEEFHKAVRALGFDVSEDDTGAVFDSLDDDKSGVLEYKELAEMLRKGAGSEKVKTNLKRGAGQAADRSRGAKLTAKNINVNYQASRVAALPPMAKLEVSDDKSIQQQLAEILHENNVKLIGAPAPCAPCREPQIERMPEAPRAPTAPAAESASIHLACTWHGLFSTAIHCLRLTTRVHASVSSFVWTCEQTCSASGTTTATAHWTRRRCDAPSPPSATRRQKKRSMPSLTQSMSTVQGTLNMRSSRRR